MRLIQVSKLRFLSLIKFGMVDNSNLLAEQPLFYPFNKSQFTSGTDIDKMSLTILKYLSMIWYICLE